LFKRGFLIRKGKTIHATEAGRGLIQSLPEVATVPDMTARWESELGKIADKQANYTGFMGEMLHTLNDLVETARNELPTHLQGVSAPKRSGRRFSKGGGKRKYTGKGKGSRAKAA
jgi:DNA topoisomerase-3